MCADTKRQIYATRNTLPFCGSDCVQSHVQRERRLNVRLTTDPWQGGADPIATLSLGPKGPRQREQPVTASKLDGG